MAEREVLFKLLLGRIVSLIAILVCVPASVLAISIAIPSVGIVLGVVGYALGARRLGLLAVVLTTVAMFVGLIVGPK